MDEEDEEVKKGRLTFSPIEYLSDQVIRCAYADRYEPANGIKLKGSESRRFVRMKRDA